MAITVKPPDQAPDASEMIVFVVALETSNIIKKFQFFFINQLIYCSQFLQTFIFTTEIFT
ncbi:hypothetical protein pb186bvf_021145 [Paramecium bursaria]